MNGSKKTNEARGRRVLDWLLSDWVWEVCLIVIVAPVVVDTFLSIGAGVTLEVHR